MFVDEQLKEIIIESLINGADVTEKELLEIITDEKMDEVKDELNEELDRFLESWIIDIRNEKGI